MADLSLTFDLIARDRAYKTFGTVGKSAETSGRKLGTAFGVGAGLAAVAVAKLGRDSVRAFTESQTSQAKLSDAFAKFPQLAGYNVDSVRNLNKELAKKTVYDDDATASGQAVLASFKLTGDQIKSVTPLLQDYAARTGKDLPTAATDLGKAVLGQGRALKDVGIKFTDTGTAAGNFAELQAGLRTQVGGFAEKEGKTAAGQAQILGNRFGEVQETVGSKLVPVLLTLAGGLGTVLGFVERNSAVIGPLVAVVGGLAIAVVTVNAAARAYAATQAALNLVLSLNPIAIVVVALAAVGVALFVAYKKSETFRDVVKGALEAVSTAGSALWTVLSTALRGIVDAFLAAAGFIIHGAAKMFGWVPGVGGKLKDAASNFDTFRDSVNTALGGAAADADLAGQAIGDGLARGMISKTDEVAIAASGLSFAAQAATRKALRLGSPSKVFAQLGSYSAQGFALGIDRDAHRAALSSAGMVERAVAAARGTFPSPGLQDASAAGTGGGAVHYHATVNNNGGNLTIAEVQRALRLARLQHS